MILFGVTILFRLERAVIFGIVARAVTMDVALLRISLPRQYSSYVRQCQSLAPAGRLVLVIVLLLNA